MNSGGDVSPHRPERSLVTGNCDVLEKSALDYAEWLDQIEAFDSTLDNTKESVKKYAEQLIQMGAHDSLLLETLASFNDGDDSKLAQILVDGEVTQREIDTFSGSDAAKDVAKYILDNNLHKNLHPRCFIKDVKKLTGNDGVFDGDASKLDVIEGRKNLLAFQRNGQDLFPAVIAMLSGPSKSAEILRFMKEVDMHSWDTNQLARVQSLLKSKFGSDPRMADLLWPMINDLTKRLVAVHDAQKVKDDVAVVPYTVRPALGYAQIAEGDSVSIGIRFFFEPSSASEPANETRRDDISMQCGQTEAGFGCWMKFE